MRRWVLAGAVLIVVASASWALAATLTGRVGTLATAQTTTGGSANTVRLEGQQVLYLEYDITAGTGTIQAEQKIRDGTNFILVPDVSSISTTDAVVKIPEPAGEYRSNVTACTGCSWTVKYHFANN